MGKKGRQGVSRNQPNPRKIQRNEAVREEKTATAAAKPEGVVEGAICKSAVDHNLGRILGLQNLGHTCFFNAAVQVPFHLASQHDKH